METQSDSIRRIMKKFEPVTKELREKFSSLSRANVQAYFDAGKMLLEQRRQAASIMPIFGAS